MKLLEKKIAPSNKSFSIYRNRKPCLDESWHYHQELELIYVLKGKGIRFIGDHVDDFAEGELALVGSNLPHLWKNYPEYYNNLGLETDTIVLQFNTEFLGQQFFDIHEMVLMKKLFTKAQNGINFLDKKLKTEILKELMSLIDLTGFQSVHCLLGILDKLSRCKDVSTFTSSGFSEKLNDKDSKRLDRVYQFVLENFHREITLSEVAEVSYLGVSPFCRFFKKRTHKPFSQFLNEVRIGHACKLLIENKLSISQIAYHCGYNSQTNFNRQFKNIKGVNPKAFQKVYLNQ